MMRNVRLRGERMRAVLGAILPLFPGDAFRERVEVAAGAALDAAGRLDEPEHDLEALAPSIVVVAHFAIDPPAPRACVRGV